MNDRGWFFPNLTALKSGQRETRPEGPSFARSSDPPTLADAGRRGLRRRQEPRAAAPPPNTGTLLDLESGHRQIPFELALGTEHHGGTTDDLSGIDGSGAVNPAVGFDELRDDLATSMDLDSAASPHFLGRAVQLLDDHIGHNHRLVA